GEEGVAWLEQVDLLLLRLLDLEYQVGLGEKRLRVGGDPRPLGDVPVVVDCAAPAGACLDDDLVAALTKLAHSDRGERDPGLVGLDLGRHAGPHRAGTPFRLSTWNAVPCRSSSGKRSSGSMQASGGWTPAASTMPRAIRRTAAAAGAPVDTTPPPIPQR